MLNGMRYFYARRKGVKMMEQLLFDNQPSMRSIDDNGFLHVALTPISKAAVNPYLGREIPDWVNLGLQAETIYYGFRDPKELEAAAATFNGIPLLLDHHSTSADFPDKENTVGATGTDAVFDGTYLKNSLAVHDAAAIKAIEDGTAKEISCAYRFTPDFTEGVFETDGQKIHYDFVMRNISGNHVALVAEGRAGHDVAVADAMPNLTGKEIDDVKKRTVLKPVQKKIVKDSLETVIAKFAPDLDDEQIAAFKDAILAEQTATDAEPVEVEEVVETPAEEVVEEATEDTDEKVEEVVEEIPEVVEETTEDAEPEAEELVEEEKPADEPTEDAEPVEEKEEITVETPDEEEVFNDEKVEEDADDEVKEEIVAEPVEEVEVVEEDEKPVEEIKEEEVVEEPAKETAEDNLDELLKDPIFKAGFDAGFLARQAYDKAVGEVEEVVEEPAMEMEEPAVEIFGEDTISKLKEQASENTRRHCRELVAAARKVEPLIGNVVDPLAYDSASDIYKLALKQSGKKVDGYDPSALKVMVDMLVDAKPVFTRTAGKREVENDCFKYLKNIAR